jgi:hypothetical protein
VWWGGLALVLVPFVVSAARLLFGVGDDYLPVQDHSVIEMFVRDVGHRKVLIGLYSRADWSHPGPAQFYALAPFYWLTGGASVGVGVGALAINAASIAGCAAIARRRGGTPLLLATLVGCALVTRTLTAEILSDPWNTYMPVLPYLLLLFLTWSMLCGDLWALPVATVVATFTAQTHIGFVALALPMLAVGGAALVLPEVRRLVGPPLSRIVGQRRTVARSDAGSIGVAGSSTGETEAVHPADPADPEGDASPDDPDPDAPDGRLPDGTAADGDAHRRRTAVIRAVLLSAGLFGLMWVPTALDVLWEAPSNVQQTYRWFDKAEEGIHNLADGWKVMTAQFSVTPEWITGAEPPLFASGEPLALYRSPVVPVLLFVAVAAAVVLWRRRVEGARALVVTLGLALVLGVLGVARTVGPAYDYRLRWTWMAPMLAFVLVVWAAWWFLVRWRPSTESRLLVPASLVALLVLAGVNSTDAATAGIPYPDDNEIMTAIAPPVVAAFDEDEGGMGGEGQVVVDRWANHIGTHTYGRGLLLQLERHGVDARVPATRIRFFPETRNQTEGRVRARLSIAVNEQIDEARADPNYRMLSIWSPLSEQEQDEVFERIDELEADYQAGRVSQLTWLSEAGRLDTELFGHKKVVAYSVAVFLDERVGEGTTWSPPTDD